MVLFPCVQAAHNFLHAAGAVFVAFGKFCRIKKEIILYDQVNSNI